MSVYLDNSATTALCQAAVDAMNSAVGYYGNPSSLHEVGMKSAELIKQSKEAVLASAGFRNGDGWQCIFTSSGTEASNLAIVGSVHAKTHFDSKRIIVSDSEHPSVLKSALSLEKEGFKVVTVPTVKGVIDLKVLESELKKGAFLVSIMMVNNETGAIYDIAAVSALVRKHCPRAVLHCDCVQAISHLPLPNKLVDMITVSAHKIHGPKGVGALLVSPDIIKSRSLSPIIFGGGQENGLRAGTENLIGIAAFAAAATYTFKNTLENAKRTNSVYQYAVSKLMSLGCKLNIPEKHVSHILSVTVPGIKSQTMLNLLSSKGIYVSNGSACSSKDSKISPVLTAFGLSTIDADCTIRISLCEDNTTEDIDALCEAIREGLSHLVKIK